MESLIELVTASFARYGIECPAGDSPSMQSVQPGPVETKSAEAVRPAVLATALPEHNYRKGSQIDPTETCP
jgi:hypothetical protein